MLYGEIVIDDVAAGSQGDDDDDQEAVNVEDALHQRCPKGRFQKYLLCKLVDFSIRL